MIERKIQNGQLVHFVDHNSTQRNEMNEPDRIIDVISGGIAAGGMSNNSKKQYAREVYQVHPGAAKKPKPNPVVISFSEADRSPGLLDDHQDPLVITTKIGTNTVKKILVDTGSAVDILYHDAFSRMELGDRKLVNLNLPLFGFTGNEVKVAGVIDLPILFGKPPCQRWHIAKFHVVNAASSYNAIIGRTTLAAIHAHISIPYLKMKFATDFGVGEILGDQVLARQCYLTSVIPKRLPVNSSVHQVVEVDPKGLLEVPNEPQCHPTEETEGIEVVLGDTSKTIKIGKELKEPLRSRVIELIREFVDIFAWDPKDLPGIPEEVVRHSLNINPTMRAVRQKKRNFSEEKRDAINVELDRLLEAGFISPVQFPEWISNVVLVKKANGKWRMCIDYSNLNKACPKDFYPLPHIDQLIDATSGHELLSFMDAFSGYNQIKMDKNDWEKTAFITHRGVFGFKNMPFGLVSAGATFQRTMDVIFASQIGRNMEVYVDDMIVKSKKRDNHDKRPAGKFPEHKEVQHEA